MLMKDLDKLLDTIKGLAYLHSRDPPIVHSDLKALNVLVNDNGRALLSDFGLAQAMEDGPTGLSTSSGFQGTFRYCSPEVLQGTSPNLQSDIWAWGCLALEIITDKLPYCEYQSDPQVLLLICGPEDARRTPEPSDPLSIPPKAIQLLRTCWSFDPQQRPTAAQCEHEIRLILRSPVRPDLPTHLYQSEHNPGYIGTDDALELLGPNTVDPRLRRLAVEQLARLDDDEISLYLLQLVQALRFESIAADDWTAVGDANADGSTPASKGESPLAEFLIDRGVRSPTLGHRLSYYIMVQFQDKLNGGMYERVEFRFLEKLMEVEGGEARFMLLKRQVELVASLLAQARQVCSSKDATPKKIETLRAYLANPKNGFMSMRPLPHPLNYRVEINGIIPEKCSIFESNSSSLLLYFQCAPKASTTPAPRDEKDGNASDSSKLKEYPIIFKFENDLRQDQLVIQLFTLMDRLLRKDNLDLKLSPYDILATGPKVGMVQFIPSMTVASIVSEYTTVLAYLWEHHRDEGNGTTYGVRPEVLDRFVRSCAGYYVLAYILGVGDHRLDNLLVAPDGHFLRVNFGKILDLDSKAFSPPIKLCPEMVDGMGGAESPHYAQFKILCFTAFGILRKSAKLIINLVALMEDANIEALVDRDVHRQLQDRFRLDLSEEKALRHFETLLHGLLP
ncbi:Phosphatidylinositol (PI) 3-kinase [Tulasnella sp. UAMH 9824]|nr:Phosphatidylinositol (PI) 3-kinase [Tulasnella sp. UAMH 9824]